MQGRLAILAALLLLAASAPVSGQEFKRGDLTIEQPFARASAGQAKTGVAYFRIRNDGAQPDRLVGIRADVAARAQLHSHLAAGSVMKMRPVPAIEVPAQGSAELKPGGDHVMLMGLKTPLTEGDTFPLTLIFEKAGEVVVEVIVESVASMGGSHPRHGAHGR